MKGLLACATAAFLGSATPALAGETCQRVAGRAEVAPAALNQALKAAGLGRVGPWRQENGCFETKARTADGKHVQVVLDPYRGTIRRHADDAAARRFGEARASR